MSPPLILDSNLALLLAVGVTSRSYIARHKRLAAYDEIDFDILTGIIAASAGVIFTPNVLTETSNLARHGNEPIRTEISAVLARLIVNAEERVVSSRVAAVRPEFAKLGLTDAVLLEVASAGGTLLTADLKLYLAAISAGLSAENFNHIKDQREDYQ